MRPGAAHVAGQARWRRGGRGEVGWPGADQAGCGGSSCVMACLALDVVHAQGLRPCGLSDYLRSREWHVPERTMMNLAAFATASRGNGHAHPPPRSSRTHKWALVGLAAGCGI